MNVQYGADVPDRRFPSEQQPVDEQPVPGPWLGSRPFPVRKGRGAVSNLQGRYEVNGREEFDDGWEREEEEAPGLRTVVSDEVAKTILTRNSSPDIPFNVSLNPYRGCEHVIRKESMSD